MASCQENVKQFPVYLIVTNTGETVLLVLESLIPALPEYYRHINIFHFQYVLAGKSLSALKFNIGRNKKVCSEHQSRWKK